MAIKKISEFEAVGDTFSNGKLLIEVNGEPKTVGLKTFNMTIGLSSGSTLSGSNLSNWKEIVSALESGRLLSCIFDYTYTQSFTGSAKVDNYIDSFVAINKDNNVCMGSKGSIITTNGTIQGGSTSSVTSIYTINKIVAVILDYNN